jgi:hypothetical protein
LGDKAARSQNFEALLLKLSGMRSPRHSIADLTSRPHAHLYCFMRPLQFLPFVQLFPSEFQGCGLLRTSADARRLTLICYARRSGPQKQPCYLFDRRSAMRAISALRCSTVNRSTISLHKEKLA